MRARVSQATTRCVRAKVPPVADCGGGLTRPLRGRGNHSLTLLPEKPNVALFRVSAVLAGGPRRRRRPVEALLVLVAVALASLFATTANAYPWMIRHEYTGCAMCHLDPSGGGVLTEYGRAQSDLLLRTQYSKPAEEASTTSRFLWGVPTPEWLFLGGSYRGMGMVQKAEGSPTVTRFAQMQADLRAGLRASVVRAGGSIGYDHQGAQAAQLTSGAKDNLVAREYWAGVAVADDSVLIRAGRVNLPFGLRHVEHTMWVRSTTHTDLNMGQQHGLAVAVNKDTVRAEVMGILGNFQVHPDAYRERGYAGYLEWSPKPAISLGLSSLMTTALLDIDTRTTRFRQAHGLFARVLPWKPLVLMAEGDVLVRSPVSEPTAVGMATMLQADLEAVQGVHIFLTGEAKAEGAGVKPSVGGWLSLNWFALPHVDLRVDGILQSVGNTTTTGTNATLLTQLHVFL